MSKPTKTSAPALSASPAPLERERANLAKLPEMAFVNVHTEDVMCIVKRGESGYYRTDWPKGCDGDSMADERNERLGVTPAQASAMSHGSMFGWDTPAADPDHDINHPERMPRAVREAR